MAACAVCGKSICDTICPACGFDESCNYESYPTLQALDVAPKSVSYLRDHPWGLDGQDPVAAAMAFLSMQGWDPKTLAEIEAILLDAQSNAGHPDDRNDPLYEALMKDLISVLRQAIQKSLDSLRTRIIFTGRGWQK